MKSIILNYILQKENSKFSKNAKNFKNIDLTQDILPKFEKIAWCNSKFFFTFSLGGHTFSIFQNS